MKINKQNALYLIPVLLILGAYPFGWHMLAIAFLTISITGGLIGYLISSQHPLVLKRVVLLLVAYTLVIVNYALAYSFLPVDYFVGGQAGTAGKLSFFDSFYFSLVTISTAGLTDIRPVHLTAKWLTITEVLLGTGILVLGIGYVISRTSESSPGDRLR